MLSQIELNGTLYSHFGEKVLQWRKRNYGVITQPSGFGEGTTILILVVPVSELHNLPVKFKKKSRKYPIKRDEYGTSARQRAFKVLVRARDQPRSS